MQGNKTKLVILSAFYEPYMSGAEQMVKQVVEYFGDFYDLTLITGLYDVELKRLEKRSNFKIIRVGIGHHTIDKFLYPILANIQILKIKPQIIHAIMESYAGVGLYFSKFISDAKRILTLQSGDLDDKRKQNNIFIKLFWRKIHKYPNLITAISNFLAERAINLGAKKEDVHVIPNGIDFKEVPKFLEKEKNRVICVARLSWEKGLDYLITAWSYVISKINDARLVIVGEGNKRAEIEKMINDLKINDSVLLMGNLPHNKTLEEISKSEVFICPSLAEGLGIVFIEAQACRVPVIGTRVGGIPDVIQNRENGILIESKSHTEISDAIIELLENKDLREQIIKNAEISVKKYSWDSILEKIHELYNI